MTQLRDHNTYNGDFVLFFLFFSFKQEDEIKLFVSCIGRSLLRWKVFFFFFLLYIFWSLCRIDDRKTALRDLLNPPCGRESCDDLILTQRQRESHVTVNSWITFLGADAAATISKSLVSSLFVSCIYDEGSNASSHPNRVGRWRDKGVTGSCFFRDLAFYRGNPRERIYSRPWSSFWILTGAILVNSGKQVKRE